MSDPRLAEAFDQWDVERAFTGLDQAEAFVATPAGASYEADAEVGAAVQTLDLPASQGWSISRFADGFYAAEVYDDAGVSIGRGDADTLPAAIKEALSDG